VSPSLNTLQPEGVSFGTEMLLQAQGPSGLYVTVGEIYNLDFELDDMLTPLPVLGSRRIGYRKGQLKVSGTIKSYWINGPVHSMVLAATAVSASGSASVVYHSALPNQRYNIRINSSNPSGYNITFINVSLAKDGLSMKPDAFVEETIPFNAEDLIWTSA
jgi:hypothetical protein